MGQNGSGGWRPGRTPRPPASVISGSALVPVPWWRTPARPDAASDPGRTPMPRLDVVQRGLPRGPPLSVDADQEHRAITVDSRVVLAPREHLVELITRSRGAWILEMRLDGRASLAQRRERSGCDRVVRPGQPGPRKPLPQACEVGQRVLVVLAGPRDLTQA